MRKKKGAILCNLSNGKRSTILNDLYFIFQVSGLRLGLQLIKREQVLNQNHPPKDNCHIWFIGVEKEKQGNGMGTEMIEYIKQKCQEKNLPIFLETSNPHNINFYEKNGFNLYKKMKLPMDDFELYFYSWYPSY